MGVPICELIQCLSFLRHASSMTKNKFSNKKSPPELRSADWAKPAFPVEKMTALLDHDNHQMRAEFRKFLSDPSFAPKYDVSLEDEREICLQRLKKICDSGKFISVTDFADNPHR